MRGFFGVASALALAIGLAWMPVLPAWSQAASDQQHVQGDGAQPAAKPGPAGGHGMMGGQMMQGGMMGMHGQAMGRPQAAAGHAQHLGPIPHVEGRLAFLRAEIGITDAQAAAWNGFADAVRKANKLWTAAPTLPMQYAMGKPPPQPQPSWLDGLEQREKALAADLEGVRAIRAAAGPLYAALSDDQKRMADALMHGPMGPMHRGPMPGPRGRM